MKKINYLLPVILFFLGIRPTFSQSTSLSDWRVPVPSSLSDWRVPPPHGDYGLRRTYSSTISQPELMETLPSIPDGGPPSAPSPSLTDQLKKIPKNKQVSNADEEYVANLVKKALAKISPCCCCCIPAVYKPVPKRKKVLKSASLTHRKKLARPIKKSAVKPKIAAAHKVKTRYVVRYRYLPYRCNCTPNIADTTKNNK